jgi:hypothetical protein
MQTFLLLFFRTKISHCEVIANNLIKKFFNKSVKTEIKKFILDTFIVDFDFYAVCVTTLN